MSDKVTNAEVLDSTNKAKNFLEFRVRIWQGHIQTACKGDRKRLDRNGMLDLCRIILAIANATGDKKLQYVLMETTDELESETKSNTTGEGTASE